MVLKAPGAWGGGGATWLPQPGRCFRQLEAQQAEVTGTASLRPVWQRGRGQGERRLP